MLGQTPSSPAATREFLSQLRAIVGPAHLLTKADATRSYRTGFRFGGGACLAVVRPGSLVEQWRVVSACAAAGKIVIMQAANTGLTGGSTPDGDDYDRDIVIINTGWHSKYGDNQDYFGRAPGLVPSAAHWLVERGVKVVGHDTQANDHPLATAIGPHGPGGPLLPHLLKEYKEFSGHEVIEDFPDWEPVHRILFSNGILGIENVGGDIDKVTGKRVTFSFFPIRWTRGDGCIIRLVAMLDKTGEYRIEKGA